jgi:hypothetical protein
MGAQASTLATQLGVPVADVTSLELSGTRFSEHDLAALCKRIDRYDDPLAAALSSGAVTITDSAINAPVEAGASFLYVMARRNHQKVVEHLLKDARVDLRAAWKHSDSCGYSAPQYNFTLAHHAVENGNVALAEALAAHGGELGGTCKPTSGRGGEYACAACLLWGRGGVCLDSARRTRVRRHRHRVGVCACAGLNMNQVAEYSLASPLAALAWVWRFDDPSPYLAAAQALVRAGAHPASGSGCETLACCALATKVTEGITKQFLRAPHTYVVERERMLRLPLVLGAGVVLDATLRNQLGRGPEGSPMGAWGWQLDRMDYDHGASIPGGHLPTSWPGAALTLLGIAAGVRHEMDIFYHYGDYEAPPEDQSMRALGPGIVAWVWGRMLEGAVIPAARYASWRRRRAAVVTAVMAEGEW